MYCKNCGTELQDEARYCPNCGEKIETEPPIHIENKTEISAKKSRAWMLCIPLIMILALIAGINYGFERGWLSTDNAAETSKQLDQTQTQQTESKQSNTNVQEDFSKVTDYHTYKTFYGNNALFYFSYPSDFFAHEIIQDNKNSVSFYMDDTATSARFSCTQRTDSNSIRQEYEEIYQDMMLALYEGEKIIAKPDTGDGARFILTGYTDASCTDSVYQLVYITEQYVMEMYIVCSPYSNFEEQAQRSYMVDCMYRMCGFSGSSKQPRSYEKFLQDDSWK